MKKKYIDTEIVDKLTLIGCTLMNKEYGWDVVIPNRSKDLTREIDLIEEVGRLIGMTDRLKPSNPIKPENCHRAIGIEKSKKWFYRKWF